jgi:hypothetical protein
VKRAALVVFIPLCFLAVRSPSIAGRRDVDSNGQQATLNKYQLASLDAAMREMQRRGWSLRKYQVVIRDEGANYSVAFMDDPLDMTTTGGAGAEWKVRKRDAKVIRGPIFYR